MIHARARILGTRLRRFCAQGPRPRGLAPKLGEAHTRCFSCSNVGLAEVTLPQPGYDDLRAQSIRTLPRNRSADRKLDLPHQALQCNLTILTSQQHRSCPACEDFALAACHARSLLLLGVPTPLCHGPLHLVAGAGCGCGAFSGMPWSTVKSLRSLPVESTRSKRKFPRSPPGT